MRDINSEVTVDKNFNYFLFFNRYFSRYYFQRNINYLGKVKTCMNAAIK